MQCLQDYIGIRWCKAEEPESDLWINDLPGISLKGLDKIANEEQITFLEVWNTIQRRSIRRLSTAIVNELAKRYKLKRTIESYSLPKIVDAVDDQTAEAAEYRGFTVSLGCNASPLQVIHIQELSFYRKVAPASGQENVTIKFFSVIETDADEVHSITFASAQGWNRIPVNKDFFDTEKVFVGYDATAIESVKLQLNDRFDFHDGCACIQMCPCDAYVKGAKSDNPFGNLEEGNNTFGLSGIISIKCMYETIVCDNKSLFATALWYLEGAETMAERMFTDRLNRYTTVDLEKAKALRSEFEYRFSEELASVLAGIDLNTYDCCLECNDVVTSVEMRP
jgi:hypothetical protein